MSIKSKFAALALAALAVTGAVASSSQAEAKGGFPIGAAIVGAAIVGTAVAASTAPGYGYYNGYGYNYRRCGWVRQFDAYGNYAGKVRTCNY